MSGVGRLSGRVLSGRGRVLAGRVGSVVPVRSLRLRVTAVAVAVVAGALVVIGFAVEWSLAAQLGRDQETRLDDRLARAALLVEAGTPPAGLPDALAGRGVGAVVVDTAGRVLAGRGADGPGAPGGPGGPDGPGAQDGSDGPGDSAGSRGPAASDGREEPGRPGGPEAGDPARPGGSARLDRAEPERTRTLALPDGMRLVLRGEPGADAAVLERLRTVLVVVGVGGLAVVTGALLVGVGIALRPLATMAGVSRAIAGGDRGRRLRPPRTDTEIGATAAAFDAMLDALEAAQAATEQAARDARRSEATTRRFLSDAAHELRTPLTGVQTLAETLVRRPDDDLERRERIATTLVRETRRAGALVADMLELARLEEDPALTRSPVDLAEIASTEAERLALVAPELDVRTDPEVTGGDGTGRGPVPVDADPQRVAQILANLLDNARRHSPRGGRVTVEVARRGDVASVVVADEGPGVPAGERERIFDRLVRLDGARGRDAGGAGLGLSIARALARAHGGDLVVEDAGGRRGDGGGGDGGGGAGGGGDSGGGGARFRLSLPVITPPAEPPPAP